MLRLKNIKKVYKIADTTVNALDGVSISFRSNEFVSILGPSGCGKTTTLNIIGGLDHYTSGDLFINGVSTKNFKSRDWDVYRNHRVGFIFQSYNLIPHQTILENVELALTIAGISKQERVEKSKKILDRVGLKGQYNKRPNQLSGGQCQRVAIARALVNDPEILLADEPTGALDTVTSVQIMDLIKEIAKERLVIMVTHNPELAEKYSSRIIRLLDGKVISDSDEFTEEDEIEECKRLNAEVDETLIKKEKAKMSLWTAFKLSWRNLKSKFKRTFMVCLAGSIGIIGVSTVLAVSSGVHGYIANMQDDMLSGNPIAISEKGYDLGKLMSSMTEAQKQQAIKDNVEDGYVNVDSLIEYLVNMQKSTSSVIIENDIQKEYVQYVQEMPKDYYSEISLDYGINMANNIYTDFDMGKDIDTENVSLTALTQIYTTTLKQSSFANYSSYITSLAKSFQQAPANDEYILSQYDIVSDKSTSHIAKNKDEIMIVVSDKTELTDVLLAELGYYTQDQFLNIAFKETLDPNYNASLEKYKFSYDELMNKSFDWYSNNSIYTKNEGMMSTCNPFTYQSYSKNITAKETKMPLKVTAILRPKKNVQYGCLQAGFYYTPALAEYMIQDSMESEIVKYIPTHNENLSSNPITKTLVTDGYYSGNMQGLDIGITYKYSYKYPGKDMVNDVTGYLGNENAMSSMMGMMAGMGGGSSSSTETEASIKEATLSELGGKDIPSNVYVYPVNFKIKDKVTNYLDAWNDTNKTITLKDGTELTSKQRNQVTYTDNLSVIINMIGMMINIVTYALVAFTSISLVVSTVMIGIITYVSVVERIKEIGVIRSLGGRKKDVSHLFNAETFIIGLFSGVLGIIITYILSLIINVIIGSLSGIYTIASLPIVDAVVMIIVSIVLTLISGLIPASSAAKKDPVVALRTE